MDDSWSPQERRVGDGRTRLSDGLALSTMVTFSSSYLRTSRTVAIPCSNGEAAMTMFIVLGAVTFTAAGLSGGDPRTSMMVAISCTHEGAAIITSVWCGGLAVSTTPTLCGGSTLPSTTATTHGSDSGAAVFTSALRGGSAASTMFALRALTTVASTCINDDAVASKLWSASPTDITLRARMMY